MGMSRWLAGARQYFLSELIAHANQYFNVCATWYSTHNDFHGRVQAPIAFSDGELLFVDWGDGNGTDYNPGSNTWREIRIVNSSHDWSYSEYIDFDFSEQAKQNPNLCVLFDLHSDPWQMSNVYDSTPQNIKDELHQMLMDYGQCQGANCP